MTQSNLQEFVKTALRAGATRPEVEAALREAGWPREQIDDALGAFADVPFVVPVPRPQAQLSARDAFIYLVTFAALYVSAYHLGSLLFQFVNLAIPDNLTESNSYAYQRIRFAVAALLVAFPVFLYLSYRTSVEVTADPVRRNSAVRRWLTYLTLTLAAFVVIGDLISLIYSLLSGELTLRFLLKSAIVAALAGGIFGYYFWTMQADDEALAP